MYHSGNNAQPSEAPLASKAAVSSSQVREEPAVYAQCRPYGGWRRASQSAEYRHRTSAGREIEQTILNHTAISLGCPSSRCRVR